MVSIDCFINEKASVDGSFFNSWYIKLLFFSILPFILAAVSILFWFVVKLLRRTAYESGKAMSTLVITLFTIHPNIVQYMFNDFNCKNIDGEYRVYNDMTILCWDTAHSFWSYTVAMPSIIVWGLGIPFFALMLLIRERKKLASIEVK